MSVLGSFLYVGFPTDQVLDSTSEGATAIGDTFSGACQVLESAAIYMEIFMNNGWQFSNRL